MFWLLVFMETVFVHLHKQTFIERPKLWLLFIHVDMRNLEFAVHGDDQLTKHDPDIFLVSLWPVICCYLVIRRARLLFELTEIFCQTLSCLSLHDVSPCAVLGTPLKSRPSLLASYGYIS